MVHTIITHLAPEVVDAQVAFLKQLDPRNTYVVAYGGTAEAYAKVAHPEKFYVRDASLRGVHNEQCYHEILEGTYAHCRSRGIAAEYYYFSEYDHFVLRADYADQLERLMRAHRLDFAGKDCSDRTGTNWVHYLRYRRDAELRRFLAAFSVREEPGRLYGCLGNGFVMSARALHGFAERAPHLPRYAEVYVPTVIYHLGYRLGDIDALGDLYRYVRYGPPFREEDVVRLMEQGGIFCHPFKDVSAYASVYARVVRGQGGA